MNLRSFLLCIAGIFLFNSHTSALTLIMPASEEHSELIHEEVDLKKTYCYIWHDTIATIIQEKKDRNLPFIIARIITIVGDAEYIHYLDAHSLNNFFSRNWKRKFRNPINMQPIEGEIFYFILNDPEQAYAFSIGSHIDYYTHKDKLLQALFTVYKEGDNSDTLPSAQLTLAQHLLAGKKITQDLARARYLFEKVVEQDHLHYSRTIAQCELAQMLLVGDGGPCDQKRARELLEEVIRNDLKENACKTARIILSELRKRRRKEAEQTPRVEKRVHL